MNQVIFQVDARRDHHRTTGRALCLGLIGLMAALLLGCEPSPTSQAVKASGTAPPAEQPRETAAVIPIPAAEETVPDSRAAEPAALTAPAEPARTVRQPRPHTGPLDGRELTLLGKTVPPGASQRLLWSSSDIFEGVSTETPVLIVNGVRAGPTLCLTAAIHGDELNGIEMVRQVLHDLAPDELRGAVIGIPIVNLQGFRRGSRYLPDRRDLNRYFPGNPQGSSASRIAYSLFNEIVRHCDALVDLHTGSFYRTNLPQLRADLRYSQIKELTRGFGGMAVLHSVAAPGTLRRAATDAGIPTITLEAGEPLRLQTAKVDQGVHGILHLLGSLDMVALTEPRNRPEPDYYDSTWVRADHGGILFSTVSLGQQVEAGEVLGTITNPITNEQNPVHSPESGRVLGMALNQVVMPGFAAFRIGIKTGVTSGSPGQLSLEQHAPGDAPMPAAVETEIDPTLGAALGEPEEASE